MFSEVEASLAEYLMEHLKSSDGKPLLKSMYSAKLLQFPEEKAMLLSKRYAYLLLKFTLYLITMHIQLVNHFPCQRAIPLVS